MEGLGTISSKLASIRRAHLPGSDLAVEAPWDLHSAELRTSLGDFILAILGLRVFRV